MARTASVLFAVLLGACGPAGSSTVSLASPSVAATQAVASSERVSPPLPTPASDFANVEAVAIAGAVHQTGATYLPGTQDVMASCPATRSKCLAVLSQVDGVRAAYLRAYLGSTNAEALCGIYTVLDPAGWRFLDMGCDAAESGQQWPDVDSVDYVFNTGSSCAYVRATPGLSGRALGCLKDGTAVTIDGGPVYVVEADQRASHLWWHLQGSGWMAHDYLIVLYA